MDRKNVGVELLSGSPIGGLADQEPHPNLPRHDDQGLGPVATKEQHVVIREPALQSAEPFAVRPCLRLASERRLVLAVMVDVDVGAVALVSGGAGRPLASSRARTTTAGSRIESNRPRLQVRRADALAAEIDTRFARDLDEHGIRDVQPRRRLALHLPLHYWQRPRRKVSLIDMRNCLQF